MNKIIWIILSVLLFAACSNSNTTNESAELSISGDTIIVNEQSPILNHLITQKPSLQDYSSEFTTVGTVRPVSGRIAEITPPFEGRVVKSHVRLGQKVNSGSPIFDFSSPEFYEATKAYFVAQSANEVAQCRYNRQKELASKGVAAQKDLEESHSDFVIANQEYEQAKATLSMFNIDAATLKMGQPLKVVTPIAGEVVKCNITIGSYVKEGAEPQVVIADLSHVWVVAQVKENNFDAIKPGDNVKVFTNAHPEKPISGTIHYVGEMLDEETRAIEVIVECNNPNKDLKLGIFCEVHFISTPTKAIILPSTAIMKEQDNDYVLIEVSKGKYVRRIVESETLTIDSSLIRKGIGENDNVVVKGSIYLNM